MTENTNKNFMKKLILLLTIITAVAFASQWTDLINPDNPVVLSNTWHKAYFYQGVKIETNAVVDLALYLTREKINANIQVLNKDINNGKLSYTTNGLVPVKNF